MKHQELFNYLSEEHGVTLMENELKEVVRIVEREKASVNPLIEICGHTIDISKVVRVTPLGGDPNWLRYDVIFEGGKSIEFYESRVRAADIPLDQFPREKFIKIWKEHLNY